uniref:ABC transporter permease subunit n=1 Tax=Salmonella enterica TaxID=28901 RepID=UPI003F78BED4
QYVTLAIIFTIIIAVIVLIVMNKTTFGYELKATGNNKFAAKYAGMKDKRNIILTMAISGALASLGASFYFLTGIENYT